MLVSELLATIKGSLEEDNVYRTDTFLLERLNEGYKLTALLSLFDERRTSIDVSGTRNFLPLPKDGNDVCIAPLFVADSNSGKRIHPSMLTQFEFYASQWEGQVDSNGAQFYSLLNPFNYAHAQVVVCPIDDATSGQYTFIGAFEPGTLVATSTPRLPANQSSILYHYVRFMSFIAEPGRSEDALDSYKDFTSDLDAFVVNLRSRFPSGRDYKPFPPEFIYDNITEQQRKVAAPKQEETQTNA